MNRKTWLLAAFVFVAVCAVRAEDEKKPDDVGKATAFKGKTFEIGEKKEVSLKLSFPADRKATVIVKGDKKTDINLFIHDSKKKEVAKDDSPGPDCEASFTPEKGGVFTLVIKNAGPGDNSVKVTVKVAK